MPKAVGFVIVLAFVALLVVLFINEQFIVTSVTASGNKYLPSQEIESASGVVNSNLFSIEPQVVELAVKHLPEVKSVHVSTSVPNRVVVNIEERQPEVLWQQGPEAYWVDHEGVAFARRSALQNLTVVNDIDQLTIKLGEPIAPSAFAAVSALRNALPDNGRALEWSSGRGIAFSDEHGWKIYFGDAREMAGKVARYRALTAQLVAQKVKIKFIDFGKGDPYYQ